VRVRRSLLVEADGGSRGNPGVAGYGALVRDAATGALLAERAAPLGKASNNVAEYSGLIAGLQAVLDLHLAQDASITVRLDSKLVVEQMAGRWKIKHADMRRLAMEARDLVRQVEWAGGQVQWQWIPRADNTAADALSNDGMDGHTVRRDHAVAQHATTQVDEMPTPAFGEGYAPLGEAVLSTETTPTLEGSCRLVLVRHGVTDFTLAGRLDGRGGSDPQLAELGLRQARAAAEAVADLLARSEARPVTILTSSLTRARQTGAEVAQRLGVEAEVDPDWDEQSFGDWDGSSMEDLAQHHRDELVRLRADADYARPGGESHRQLAARVSDAFARAVARGGNVVVASHRKPLMCVLGQVLGIDHERIWSVATAPTSLTALEVWPDGGVQVAFVNDTHHLHGLEQA